MILRFDPDATTARLIGRFNTRLYATLDRALTYTEPGYWMTPEYKRGETDGRVSILQTESSDVIFPAGLAHRVLAVLEAFEIAPDVEDLRPLPPWGALPPEPVVTLHDRARGSITLYADQIEALSTFMEEYRGCVVLPTGTGKTELLAALLATARTARALVIVDRKGLMSQTADRLSERLREPVGKLGGGFRDERRRVTVANIQMLWAHLSRYERELFPSIQILAVDEAHRISPRTWFQTLSRIPAPVRLGLSATIREAPRRMIVESFLGPIVHEGRIDEAIAAGRVAEPEICFLPVGELSDDTTDLATAYTRDIVRGEERNRLIVDAMQECIRLGLPVLTLVVRIEHGFELQALLEQRELEQLGRAFDVPFLWGGTPLDVVDAAKRGMANGNVLGLFASTIFDLGQDVPSVRVVILAGGQRSPLLAIQRVGRGIRAKTTDNRVRVLDFHDLRNRTLRNQSENRETTFRRKYGRSRVRRIASINEMLTS